MICYKDMTFCPFWEDCFDGIECPRSLMDSDRVKAEDAGLGIMQYALPPTECFKPKEEPK